MSDVRLLLSGKKDAPIRVSALKVGPVNVDTAKTAVTVGPVDLSLNLDVVREKDGAIDLAKLFAPQESASGKPAPKSSSPAWSVAVEQFSLSGSGVSLTDQTLSKPSRLEVDQISFLTKNLSTDLAKAIPLTLSCRVEETGTVKASGDIVPSTMVTKGTVDLSRIPLSAASAYVADAATVDIPAGRLARQAELAHGRKGQGPALRLRQGRWPPRHGRPVESGDPRLQDPGRLTAGPAA